MFTDGFNPAETIAAAVCSRCLAVGLVKSTAEAYRNAPEVDRHMGGILSPSLDARCPACGLVGEWPVMANDCGATLAHRGDYEILL